MGEKISEILIWIKQFFIALPRADKEVLISLAVGVFCLVGIIIALIFLLRSDRKKAPPEEGRVPLEGCSLKELDRYLNEIEEDKK